LEIPKTLARRVPVDGTQEEQLNAHQKIQDELARRIAEVADHLPGSKFHEIEFTSPGPSQEITIENTFDFTPNRVHVVSRKGDYNVWEPREDLADDSFIYLSTSAPKGTKFVARVWRT